MSDEKIKRVRFEIAKMERNSMNNPVVGHYEKTGNFVSFPAEYLDKAVISEINSGRFRVMEIIFIGIYSGQRNENHSITVVADSMEELDQPETA